MSKPYGCVKETDGALMGCHATQTEAQAQQAALYASEARHMLERTQALDVEIR